MKRRGPKAKGWAEKRHNFPNITVTGHTIEWVEHVSRRINQPISRITEIALTEYLQNHGLKPPKKY